MGTGTRPFLNMDGRMAWPLAGPQTGGRGLETSMLAPSTTPQGQGLLGGEVAGGVAIRVDSRGTLPESVLVPGGNRRGPRGAGMRRRIGGAPLERRG